MTRTAKLHELSDALGVSSSLYLGMTDMLKLKAALEEPEDATHVKCTLKRLSMVPMTAALESESGIVACVRELRTDEALQAAAAEGNADAKSISKLMGRLVSAWDAHIAKERESTERAQAVAEALAWKDPSCLACQGRHRAHTCAARAKK